MAKNYDDTSIKALKGAERVRKRPSVMFGTDDMRGAFHTFKEILDNSLDEARAGFGKKILVTLYKDKSIAVRDYGRGVPMDWNPNEDRYNWDLVYNELYAGGKYDDDDDTYKFAKGLNGLGSASSQYTSEFFNVKSYREDTIYEKNFEKGVPTEDELVKKVNDTGETGTDIHWKVDNEVFSDTDFKFSQFKEYCESQAHLNTVDFHLYDEASDTHIEYKGEDIETYFRDQIGDKVLSVLSKSAQDKGVERGKKYICECDVLLAITEETKSKELYFHNTGPMTTGVHYSATSLAITDFFKSIGKVKGVTIKPYDYSDYISVLVSSYSNANATSFANQTKDGVDNQFIFSIIYNTIKDILEEAVAKNESVITTLIDNVVGAAFARKKAKELEAQERLIRKTTSNRRPKAKKIEECRETDPAKRELFIVEGDSAKGACLDARDGKFQALLPVKGKPLNCLKATLEEILDNDEIKDIIATVGTGIDVDGTDIFDLSKLQYHKIIFTTDADVDGYQIRALLYTIFYRLMPQLLEGGYLYVAETPLFAVDLMRPMIIQDEQGFDKSVTTRYAYSVEEKEEIVKDCENKGVMIKGIRRFKGLGEANEDMLWETTMCPESRRLVQLTIDTKDEMVRAVSNMLFGKDPTKERKGFVYNALQVGLVDLDDAVVGVDVATDDLVAVDA